MSTRTLTDDCLADMYRTWGTLDGADVFRLLEAVELSGGSARRAAKIVREHRADLARDTREAVECLESGTLAY